MGTKARVNVRVFTHMGLQYFNIIKFTSHVIVPGKGANKNGITINNNANCISKYQAAKH